MKLFKFYPNKKSFGFTVFEIGNRAVFGFFVGWFLRQQSFFTFHICSAVERLLHMEFGVLDSHVNISLFDQIEDDKWYWQFPQNKEDEIE